MSVSGRASPLPSLASGVCYGAGGAIFLAGRGGGARRDRTHAGAVTVLTRGVSTKIDPWCLDKPPFSL
jgi:hypothetical protein